MNVKVIIIGAGGHGRVIADIIRANGDTVLGFLDDDNTKDVLGSISDYSKYADAYFIVGIGNNALRKKLSALPVKWYTAIHPSAIVSPSAVISEGTAIMPNAVINANAVVGKHCIVNTGAIVEHDDNIGDYSHVSVGAKIGGTVKAGQSVWIGIGATVINNVTICDECTIGAGAVVIDNITTSGIYVGVPAKKH